VIGWLRARTPQFREAIRFVAIDPAAVYAKALTTLGLLPNATVVLDHFHLVKLANEALTTVRRRVIWEQRGRRGCKIDPAWANRRRLLTAKNDSRPRRSPRCGTRWSTPSPPGKSSPPGSPRKNCATCSHWLAPPRTVTSSASDSTFSRTGAPPPNIDELSTLANTIETWWPAIEAFIYSGVTNARTEGINRLIKQVKRSACGFRNPTNGHRRIRFHCTRNNRAATAASRSLPTQS
jgi:transposase